MKYNAYDPSVVGIAANTQHATKNPFFFGSNTELGIINEAGQEISVRVTGFVSELARHPRNILAKNTLALIVAPLVLGKGNPSALQKKNIHVPVNNLLLTLSRDERMQKEVAKALQLILVEPMRVLKENRALGQNGEFSNLEGFGVKIEELIGGNLYNLLQKTSQNNGYAFPNTIQLDTANLPQQSALEPEQQDAVSSLLAALGRSFTRAAHQFKSGSTRR